MTRFVGATKPNVYLSLSLVYWICSENIDGYVLLTSTRISLKTVTTLKSVVEPLISLVAAYG